MKLDLPLVPVDEEVEIMTPATATGRCSNLGQAPATMEFLLQPINRYGSDAWPNIIIVFGSVVGN